MSLGSFSLINKFLSVDQCSEIICSLPRQDNISQIEKYELTQIGVWHKNTITDQRIALPIDKSLEQKICKEILGEGFSSTGKMYITNYKQGQFCKRHIDPTDVTAIILLNNDFSGGEFVLENLKIKLDVGDILVFDKRKHHSVMPITSGNRYALSLWFDKNKAGYEQCL